jgi:hypothetical protein
MSFGDYLERAHEHRLGIIRLNGRFARYADADTDVLWTGLAIGTRYAERLSRATASATKQATERSMHQGHTVLVRYPDYLAADYGQDIYLGWSDHDDAGRAVEAVQLTACQSFNLSPADGCAADFYPLLVLRGKHEAVVFEQNNVTYREAA